MRRPLVLLFLLLTIMGCSSNSVLSVDQVTSKMDEAGLCNVTPTITPIIAKPFAVWRCQSVSSEDISIDVWDTREAFLEYQRKECALPFTFYKDYAYGENWVINQTADRGATASAIAEALGGNTAADYKSICRAQNLD